MPHHEVVYNYVEDVDPNLVSSQETRGRGRWKSLRRRGRLDRRCKMPGKAHGRQMGVGREEEEIAPSWEELLGRWVALLAGWTRWRGVRRARRRRAEGGDERSVGASRLAWQSRWLQRHPGAAGECPMTEAMGAGGDGTSLQRG